MTQPHIYLGNLNYSSWSMRPWLVLKRSGLSFDETVLPLLTEEFTDKIGALSPTRLVPVLHVGDAQITDSLAISEWAAEQVPSLWPEDPTKRAEARAITAHMHGGYLNVRKELPVNLRRDAPRPALPKVAELEIAQMQSLWARCLERSGGPFLFGDWCIADAFYTPVATRFRSYHIDIDPAAQTYCDALLAEPEFLEWERRAKLETYTIPAFDSESPGQAGWLADS